MKSSTDQPTTTFYSGLKFIHELVLVLLVLITIVKLVVPVLSDPDFGIKIESDGRLVIQDFSAHMMFVREAWKGEANYSVESHLEIVQRWARLPIQKTLPFGYSPTAIWVLAPLTPFSIRIAHVIWVMFSLASVVWIARPQRTLLIASSLVFLSPTSFHCMALGQSAILTTALFFLALPKLTAGNPVESTIKSNWLAVLCLWALTSKPPLAIVLGGILLSQRRYRTVFHAILLTALTTLIITPILGWNWPTDYLQMISHYDRESGHQAFVWSFRPDMMGNLRALLSVTFNNSDSWSSQVSQIFWVVTTAVCVFAGHRRLLDEWKCTMLCILSFLLFFSHVSFTEEILLVLLLTIPWSSVSLQKNRQSWIPLTTCLLVIAIVFSLGFGGASEQIVVTFKFAAKIALSLLVLRVDPVSQNSNES